MDKLDKKEPSPAIRIRLRSEFTEGTKGYVSEEGLLTLGDGMSLGIMTEEHRRMRTLSRGDVGNLILLAHGVKQYLAAVHDGQAASMLPLELCMDLVEGVRPPIPELVGAKVLKPERLAEMACKAFKTQEEPH